MKRARPSASPLRCSLASLLQVGSRCQTTQSNLNPHSRPLLLDLEPHTTLTRTLLARRLLRPLCSRLAARDQVAAVARTRLVVMSRQIHTLQVTDDDASTDELLARQLQEEEEEEGGDGGGGRRSNGVSVSPETMAAIAAVNAAASAVPAASASSSSSSSSSSWASAARAARDQQLARIANESQTGSRSGSHSGGSGGSGSSPHKSRRSSSGGGSGGVDPPAINLGCDPSVGDETAFFLSRVSGQLNRCALSLGVMLSGDVQRCILINCTIRFQTTRRHTACAVSYTRQVGPGFIAHLSLCSVCLLCATCSCACVACCCCRHA